MSGSADLRHTALKLAKTLPALLMLVGLPTCSSRCSRSQPSPSVDARKSPLGPLTPSSRPGVRRPNVVFVLTDDLSRNLVQFMPHVLEMKKNGTTFANYYVTDSLCCPSRSSIFTGRFPHDTGIFTNGGTDGGYLAFVSRGLERSTFATALASSGYQTAMLGKYLNGYFPIKHGPAPGWSFWSVAGDGYANFRYNLNEDGKLVHYADKPEDYLTDVIAGQAARFIEARRTPFLIEVATFAPHAPYTPAPRHAEALPGVRAPRTAAFDAAPDANAPKWLHAMPPLSEADITRIDADFRKRAQAVLAVDEMIGKLQAAVAAIGEDKNTYFIFSSDNGYHMGEHRLMPGKQTPYETDIHVPLIVTGPGVPAGRTADDFVDNTDLCPTFAELGGAPSPAGVDGKSLVPLLHGETPPWRTSVIVEHHGPHKDPTDVDAPVIRGGNPTTYESIRNRTSLYVEYVDGEKEFHDLSTDPEELRNTFSSLPEAQKAKLHATLAAVKDCHDAATCWAAQSVTSLTSPL